MSWFGWKKRQKQGIAVMNSEDEPRRAKTFVEATGGGWHESPDVIAGNGGSQTDFVKQLLEQAAEQAQKVEIGEEFIFVISDIPHGISSPHEIVAGLIMSAYGYGLDFDRIVDEEVWFTRLR